MLKKTFILLVFFFPIFSHHILFAQCQNGLQVDGSPCPNPISTAVPFLRIIPDARSGAMGDVGIALTPTSVGNLEKLTNPTPSGWGVRQRAHSALAKNTIK